MIFFLLALVALVFALMGFLTHAFYFNRKGRVGNLKKEIENLNRLLALRDQAKADAELQKTVAKNRVQSLESHLQQRNELLTSLQATVQRQANEIRRLAAQAMEGKDAVQGADKSEPAAVSGNGEKLPLWKDNLNNILEMLEKIEKEK